MLDRRTFITVTAAALATAPFAFHATDVHAQDLEFLAALERAQRDRPKTLSSVARIAPESEPGIPLIVRGRAVAEDGKTPVVGAVVFAYHTDRTGVYDRPGSPAHSWRLKGWAKTDAEGRFEFHTIRPGGYPGRKDPEHIHVNIYTPDGPRAWADGVVFDDDPRVTQEMKEESARKGAFGTVQHVRHEGGTQVVDYIFRLNPKNRF